MLIDYEDKIEKVNTSDRLSGVASEKESVINNIYKKIMQRCGQ